MRIGNYPKNTRVSNNLNSYVIKLVAEGDILVPGNIGAHKVDTVEFNAVTFDLANHIALGVFDGFRAQGLE